VNGGFPGTPGTPVANNASTGGEGGWQTLEEDDIGDPGKFNPGGFEGCSEEGPVGERYFVGIIDILMLYTRRKKLERMWKSATEGTSGGGCSSQPPAKYAIRFCKWIDNMTE